MAEPTVPVREMVDLIVDQWNRGLEAHEALRLLLPLTYRVLNAEAPASIAEPTTQAPVEPRDYPFHPGDPVWTSAGPNLRHWFVDQAGAWVEADADAGDESVPPPLMQAWHGDDTTELRADDAKPAPQTMVNGPLSEVMRRRNQLAATYALSSGRISVEEVGAVVKGLHDASVYRVQPVVSGE